MILHLHKDRTPLSQLQGISQGSMDGLVMFGCIIPIAGREHCEFLLACFAM